MKQFGLATLFVLLLLSKLAWSQAPEQVRASQAVTVPSIEDGSSPRDKVQAEAVGVLRELAVRANVIFAGHVLQVERHDASGYVDVTFAIDHSVRGCDGFNSYMLREWAGLWAEEPARYGVGQRLLMILPERGAAGMSAPVGGQLGRIPLVGVGSAPLIRRAEEAPADAGETGQPQQAVDLRWVEAAALRGVAGGPEALLEQRKSNGWAGPVAPGNVKPGIAPRLSAVLAVLGAI